MDVKKVMVVVISLFLMGGHCQRNKNETIDLNNFIQSYGIIISDTVKRVNESVDDKYWQSKVCEDIKKSYDEQDMRGFCKQYRVQQDCKERVEEFKEEFDDVMRKLKSELGILISNIDGWGEMGDVSKQEILARVYVASRNFLSVLHEYKIENLTMLTDLYESLKTMLKTLETETLE